MKIAIYGYSGSGKSTLAKRLGSCYGVPVLHLDTVQFLPGWKKRDNDEARGIVAGFMQQPGWVIEGNYKRYLQKERFEAADQIIFLSFARIPCLIRAYRRFFKNRNRCRDDMGAGCIEKMDLQFTWWLLYQGRTKTVRQHHQSIQARYPGKCIVIKNQRQLDRFAANPDLAFRAVRGERRNHANE